MTQQQMYIVLTIKKKGKKTMRITPINQQMNTNRMNQNASVNRSSNTSKMQNPSFGTTIAPEASSRIVNWLKEASDSFVLKYVKRYQRNVAALEKDAHPKDVIKFEEIKLVDDTSFSYTPRLLVQYKGSKLPPIFLSSRIGVDDIEIQLGELIDRLDPKYINKLRQEAIKPINDKIAAQKLRESL